MRKSENFTSRMAGWSATHHKGVVRGWLAFVLIAFALGSVAGIVTLRQYETDNGQSRLADETQLQQFPRIRSPELVLFESRNGLLAATDYRAAVSDLVARLSRIPSVTSIISPTAPGNGDRISKDARAALLSFQIIGSPDTAQDRV